MRIGVFDSGVGGLTVLKSLYKKYPNNEYYYIADSKHLPYGEKTKEELFSYASSIIDYFITQDIKVIVIGCNTICSTVYKDLESKYKDINFIGVIDATVDLFFKANKKNVLIIGTTNTIKSNNYGKRETHTRHRRSQRRYVPGTHSSRQTLSGRTRAHHWHRHTRDVRRATPA